MIKRKAYSYIRMSTETQLKGDSLRRQLEASEVYAKNNNLELVDSINGIPLRDIGISAFKSKNVQKGVLSVFLEALKQGKIEKNSVLLVESLDRLSRDKLTEALAQFMSILSYDIEIITLADNQRYTKELLNQNAGPLFLSLGIMFRANEESEIKSKRISAVWETKRKNASTKIITKKCPSWLRYSEQTQKFEIIEERAAIVKKIFQMSINNLGLWSITRYLNQNKIPVFGRGKIWYNAFVTGLIKDRSVLGEFQPSTFANGFRQEAGEAIKNYFPQIIDEKTFLLAQIGVSNRAKKGVGRKGVVYTNLFTGLIFCSSCGFKMTIKTAGGNQPHKKYLKCSNTLVGAGCENHGYWGLDEFEHKILSHLKEVNFRELWAKITGENETNVDDTIEALKQKIKELDSKIEQAIDYKFEPNISETTIRRYDERIAKFESDVEITKNELQSALEQKYESIEQQNIFNSEEVNDLVQKIESKNDYLSRSSISHFLNKVIEKIILEENSETILLHELNEKSPEVRAYRAKYKTSADIPVEKIVKNKKFAIVFRDYHRKVKIFYKSGAVRQLMWGDNFSLQTKSEKMNNWK